MLVSWRVVHESYTNLSGEATQLGRKAVALGNLAERKVWTFNERPSALSVFLIVFNITHQRLDGLVQDRHGG